MYNFSFVYTGETLEEQAIKQGLTLGEKAEHFEYLSKCLRDLEEHTNMSRKTYMDITNGLLEKMIDNISCIGEEGRTIEDGSLSN